MKIAAVQLNAIFADVKSNLFLSEKHVKQAAFDNAELVLLPEFFTSAIGFSDKMLAVAMENSQVQNTLKQWAVKYKIIIGGSYITFDGYNAFNIFTLVFPDGRIYKHRKDIPTQFENCYYTFGDENNILYTPIGNIGVALCWEMIRYDTAKRLAGNVDIILSGSCWWDLPKNAPLERESLRQYNQTLAMQTPVAFAKLLGVPVVHANHCGEVTAFNFPNSGREQTRQLIGATQIVDENGYVVERKLFSDGEGVVIADISWDIANRKNISISPSKYWIPDLPDSYINAWESINPKAKQYYDTIALPYYKSNSYKHN